jgi:hypothetical protein
VEFAAIVLSNHAIHAVKEPAHFHDSTLNRMWTKANGDRNCIRSKLGKLSAEC